VTVSKRGILCFCGLAWGKGVTIRSRRRPRQAKPGTAFNSIQQRPRVSPGDKCGRIINLLLHLAIARYEYEVLRQMIRTMARRPYFHIRRIFAALQL